MNLLLDLSESQEWLTLQESELGKMPSLKKCIWDSPDSYNTLLLVGRQAQHRARHDPESLHLLFNIGIILRDQTFLSNAFLCLLKSSLSLPWKNYYHFEFAKICANESALVLEQAVTSLKSFLGVLPESASKSILEAIWTINRDITSVIPSNQLSKILPRISLADRVLMGEANAFEKVKPVDLRISEHIASSALRLYSLKYSSIRHPFCKWSDPAGYDRRAVNSIISDIKTSISLKKGYSLIRLGDGEGLFLLGRRPDIGGAVSNGSIIHDRIRANKNALSDNEYSLLRDEFKEALLGADVIGIPDIYQCVHGPLNYATVAASLIELFSSTDLDSIVSKIVQGGCHIHNSMLFVGGLQKNVLGLPRAVIGPSLPCALDVCSSVELLRIPGERIFRASEHDESSHYPFHYERVVAWIKQNVSPGDLILIGAGILGKIYCSEIKKMGGIALDIGSVLDVASGLISTRGEYRVHPFMKPLALSAFL